MKKLTLNKKTITKLSVAEQSSVMGGLAFTTSFGSCTGFLCCDPQPKITELYTTCQSDGQPTRPDCNSQACPTNPPPQS
jgi:hypothetical protein